MDAIPLPHHSRTGGEQIDRPNPEPMESSLPDSVKVLAVQLDKKKLDLDTNQSLSDFRRAACYIAAAMIFLKDNVLVERDLTFDDIKPRLLGHWGTCPGLILVYSHLNNLIKKNDLEMIFVVGPGHGAPAILASLWIEGSLGHFYPHHINAETPGAIHEGGELGYALSVAFGAVMDKPDLVVACIVGDGESETGPTAAAWHGYKYIDPAESGAIIPIVHINGFKISERTIYGCMDNKELAALFSGYGYQPRFVEDLEDIDADLSASMDWSLQEIKSIQEAARSGKPKTKPRWPVLVLRTPKGWSGPKKVHGEFIEGSFRSHQVPLPAAKTDPGELKNLQSWLTSYKPKELFTDEGNVVESVLNIIPKSDSLKLGQKKETYDAFEPLQVPDWQRFGVRKGTQDSCMKVIGELLDQVLVDNPQTMRVFSPDELTSNKLDAVFSHTSRNFQWDQFSNNSGGRVIEMLSEHTLEGFLQGYTMTGRVGLFPSYESFLGIVHTMMVQYSKFVKMARETSWRKDIGSVNYLETSTWTRQDHNGFSHQNPSFIGAVLNLKPTAARVYLPPDANTFLSTLAHCLRSKNYVNLMVGSKATQPVYLSPEEADSHCRAGASVWKFASTDEGLNPDVVLVGIGCEITFEVVAAASLLRKIAPYLRLRVINVTDLMILGLEGSHPHSLSLDDFDSLFTTDRHVHFNYHGYAGELKGLLFGRPNLHRVSIESYREEGSTTTPFDMMLRNHVSRYHVAKAAVKGASQWNEKVKVDMHVLLSELDHDISKAQQYIVEHGSGEFLSHSQTRVDNSN
ncbi:MAG: hypothetical protein M1833_003533 [Piccolia ochrophora]|nr:MAG: hypothetical protein M1833_003533 [Piccolia ochrophora]